MKASEDAAPPPARLLAAAGALLLAAPVLSSCGFDYATDRAYTPGAGANDRDAKVDVLGAVVVCAEDGSGTFIASFSNNDTDEPATVSAIAGAGDDAALDDRRLRPDRDPGRAASSTSAAPTAADRRRPATSRPATSSTLTFTFGNGEHRRAGRPDVADCDEYAGLDADGRRDREHARRASTVH